MILDQDEQGRSIPPTTFALLRLIGMLNPEKKLKQADCFRSLMVQRKVRQNKEQGIVTPLKKKRARQASSDEVPSSSTTKAAASRNLAGAEISLPGRKQRDNPYELVGVHTGAKTLSDLLDAQQNAFAENASAAAVRLRQQCEPPDYGTCASGASRAAVVAGSAGAV